MRNKTALVDCDGVLADFVTAAVRGTSLRPENVTEWNFIEKQLTAEENKYVKNKLASPYFWGHEIKPREDAAGFGDRLQRLGYSRIVVVTAPWSQDVMAARADWLTKHFGGQFDVLVFDSQKAHYAGDILIEDGIHNLEVWRAANSTGTALCMDAPYNQDWQGHRILDWGELPAFMARANETESQRLGLY